MDMDIAVDTVAYIPLLCLQFGGYCGREEEDSSRSICYEGTDRRGESSSCIMKVGTILGYP